MLKGLETSWGINKGKRLTVKGASGFRACWHSALGKTLDEIKRLSRWTFKYEAVECVNDHCNEAMSSERNTGRPSWEKNALGAMRSNDRSPP